MPTVMQPWTPDPATLGFLEQVGAAGNPPISTLGPEAARQAMLGGQVNDVNPPPVANVSDRTIPGPAGDAVAAATGSCARAWRRIRGAELAPARSER